MVVVRVGRHLLYPGGRVRKMTVKEMLLFAVGRFRSVRI